jgi:RNA polymerase sigma-70 factor, ECF subfamily
LTEQALNTNIEKIKQGDATAFEKVYDTYSSALFGVCLKIVNDQELAEDILQEAFVKIWKNIHFYEPSKGTFFTWMLNITRNTAIDKYRQAKKVSFSSIQNDGRNVSYFKENNTSINTNHIGVQELLNKLPEDQREIIDYLYYKGYTQQELSDELGIPLGTVKTKSRTALKTLKELFILLILLKWM